MVIIPALAGTSQEAPTSKRQRRWWEYVTKLQTLVYHNLREQFGLKSQMACNACTIVAGTYATMKTNLNGKYELAEYKKPKLVYSYNRDYTLSFDEETKTGTCSIGTLSKRIKLPFTAKGMEHFLDGSWEFGTAQLVYKKGKFFLHIAVKKEFSTPLPTDIKNIVGADFGMNFIVTATNTKKKTMFTNGRFMKCKKAQFQRTRKSLQQTKTPSSRRRLKKIGSRENRWQTDVNHCVSKALVRFAGEGSLIALEDLTGIRKSTERVKRKNRYYSVSWAFHQLRTFVEYKAKRNQTEVVAVDSKYTSQKCPICGHTECANRNKKKHHFCCKSCGYQSNDDRVASLNLQALGIKYRHQECLKTLAVHMA